jgi:hypothetical protein
MCPVVVIERFEFAPDVQQMGLVHHEGAVEQFGSAGSDPAFHDRVHPWYADPGRDYCDAVVGKNVWVPNWSSTSCDVGVFVYQPVEQVATSDVRLGWRRRGW